MKFKINIKEFPSEEELRNLFSQTTWASKRKNQDIKKMLESLTVFVTVRENSKLIGFGRALSDGIYRALIDDIIVDNTYQKRGIGRIIIENILKQLDGIDEIFLNTKPNLEEFYKKFGFDKVSTITMKK
ncbi:GNAT family N-acetyltransferase [Sabulilitoribacter multivorans]|uniref:GNAT family N-acetyltransferase n=1 Tax=Flaviramulus multivorans TaxID=1304750 RepID=A0ABS9ILK7_9FLAO|nr:GNAT family N-acetyltransferase [Flaviramulus multivorans]MCF7561497.1 GNAT family N-acetyltransferase [Flaviramulus multivorans]